jgi:hypothetical protein
MEDYTHSFRLFPLWAVLALTIPVGLGAWGVSSARYADSLAGTPLFALFGYGLAVGYLNRLSVRVNAEGVATEFGPLPCGVQPEWMPREEIARVYIRYVGKHWAAGVESISGRCLDLTDPLASGEAIRQTAGMVAAHLGWPEPVEILREPVAADRKHAGPLLLWAGLVAAAFAWGLLNSF